MLYSEDFLWGSSVNIRTTQRRLAWPLRKDDTLTSRSVSNLLNVIFRPPQTPILYNMCRLHIHIILYAIHSY